MSEILFIPMASVTTALEDGYTLRMEGNRVRAWRELPGLTPRMLECLQFIHEAMEETNVCPSYEEIGYALELRSRSNVHRLVRSLVDRGYLVDQPYAARSLRVTKDAEEVLR